MRTPSKPTDLTNETFGSPSKAHSQPCFRRNPTACDSLNKTLALLLRFLIGFHICNSIYLFRRFVNSFFKKRAFVGVIFTVLKFWKQEGNKRRMDGCGF